MRINATVGKAADKEATRNMEDSLMLKWFFRSGLALTVCVTSAAAQDAMIGAEIFQERCAVCHGETGAGDGMVGELFDRKPRNLTLLAKDNGGVFPFEGVYQSIDGRQEIKGHGYSKMPVWGHYFIAEEMEDPASNPRDAKAVAQGRILAVVYFLQSIQAE